MTTAPDISLADLRALWRHAKYLHENSSCDDVGDVFRGYVREEVARRTIASLEAELVEKQKYILQVEREVTRLRAELSECVAWEPISLVGESEDLEMMRRILSQLTGRYLMYSGSREPVWLCRRTSGNAGLGEE